MQRHSRWVGVGERFIATYQPAPEQPGFSPSHSGKRSSATPTSRTPSMTLHQPQSSRPVRAGPVPAVSQAPGRGLESGGQGRGCSSNKGVGSPGDYPRCEFRDRPDSWSRHGECAPQGAHRAALAGTGPARAGRVHSTKRDRYERVHIALIHSRRANESLQELLCTRFTRFGEDLLRRAFLNDAAFVEEAHAV